MDLVRYAKPTAMNLIIHWHAYEYRDYLIRAFNADVPFDQFIREHIAGDLLPEPRKMLMKAGMSRSLNRVLVPPRGDTCAH